jgi:hypothetical protein
LSNVATEEIGATTSALVLTGRERATALRQVHPIKSVVSTKRVRRCVERCASIVAERRIEAAVYVLVDGIDAEGMTGFDGLVTKGTAVLALAAAGAIGNTLGLTLLPREGEGRARAIYVKNITQWAEGGSCIRDGIVDRGWIACRDRVVQRRQARAEIRDRSRQLGFAVPSAHVDPLLIDRVR